MPRVVAVLDRCKQRDVSQDYTYYGLASPWLQVKCLRLLQYFPPPEEPATRRMLAEVVKRILGGGRGVVGARSACCGQWPLRGAHALLCCWEWAPFLGQQGEERRLLRSL